MLENSDQTLAELAQDKVVIKDEETDDSSLLRSVILIEGHSGDASRLDKGIVPSFHIPQVRSWFMYVSTL